MTARLTILLLVLLVATGAVAGCGDDEGDGGANGGSSVAGTEASSGGGDGAEAGNDGDAGAPSEADFAEQATAICRGERTELIAQVGEYTAKNPAKKGSSPEETALAVFSAVQLPIIESELEKIRALGVPAEGAAQVEAFIESEQAAIDAARQLSGTKGKQAMVDRFSEAAKRARAAGIPACGNSALITG